MTRGDALAEAVLAAFHEREDGAISADEFEARVVNAHDTYRASQVGERVRLRLLQTVKPVEEVESGSPHIWAIEDDVVADLALPVADWIDHGYIEFPIPPRTTPPSVDAEVCE